jgi:hypothetical protein
MLGLLYFSAALIALLFLAVACAGFYAEVVARSVPVE